MQCMVCHDSRVHEEHDEDYEKHEEYRQEDYETCNPISIIVG